MPHFGRWAGERTGGDGTLNFERLRIRCRAVRRTGDAWLLPGSRGSGEQIRTYCFVLRAALIATIVTILLEIKLGFALLGLCLAG